MKSLHSLTYNSLTNYYVCKPQSQIKPMFNLRDKLVLSRDGKILGNISEIMLDITSGKICYVILDFMRNSQMIDKLIALPWDALLYDFESDTYNLNVDYGKLHLAPSFTQNNWPDMTDETWADSIHSFYGTFMKRSNTLHSAM